MAKVTKDMGILEIAQNHPEAIEVFQKYGMGCLGCAAARFENLEAGAKVHGFDVEQMVNDINAAIGEQSDYIQKSSVLAELCFFIVKIFYLTTSIILKNSV